MVNRTTNIVRIIIGDYLDSFVKVLGFLGIIYKSVFFGGVEFVVLEENCFCTQATLKHIFWNRLVSCQYMARFQLDLIS